MFVSVLLQLCVFSVESGAAHSASLVGPEQNCERAVAVVWKPLFQKRLGLQKVEHIRSSSSEAAEGWAAS